MPEKSKLAITPKVVHLDPDSNKTTRARLGRLPAAVHAVHEKGKFLIASRLSLFFDQVDDSLFELADKAGSNQDQNIYFDSMREIRVQRRGFERAFAQAVEEAFALLMAPDRGEEEPASETLTSNTLSLISNEHLEEMVAVDSTVSRASREFAEAIQHLSLRLDSLVPAKVYQKNNPLGPQVLCSAFTSQVKGLDVDIKVKLVLFKLFDRAVISELEEVYKGANTLLAEHNVLLSLTSGHGFVGETSSASPHYQANRQTPAHSVSQTHANPSGVNPEVLDALRQLFGDKLVSEASPHEQMVAGSELMSLLSLAQRSPSPMQAPVGGQMQQPVGDIRLILGEMQKQSGIEANIGKVDDEIINLVSMLFEFILQDKNLATPMKALISRMQIPFVKVALVDKTFFTKGGHSARRLLNEMATAALGWQSTTAGGAKDDPLYGKMEHIVNRLLHDFDSDVSIFQELLADFNAFMDNERRRSALMEKRTLDAEDGKAKAEIARTTVALEIELRTQDRAVPKVVKKLIDEAWGNVLFVLSLKHGYDSREWQGALATLEDLLWSVVVPESADQRKRLIKLVPDLLKRLRSGFDTISFNPFEMSSLFKSLEDVHLACIRGNKLPLEIMAPTVSTPISRVSIAKSEVKKAKARTKPKAKAPEAGAAQVRKEPEAPKALERVATMEAVNDESNRKTENLAESDFHMRQVENFVQGAWFEWIQEDGEVSRCRLAAYIKPTGKYIFVNRNGMKVAEKTQQELAIILKNKQIRPLDNSMLFDRALETVVTSLRKNT